MAEQITLPACLMRAIELLIADEETTPLESYVGAVLISLGYGVYQQQEEIDPTKIKIPEAQWLEICAWLTAMPGNDIARVNHGLDWMNQGPSSYKIGATK